jgi:hypothetical protein
MYFHNKKSKEEPSIYFSLDVYPFIHGISAGIMFCPVLSCFASFYYLLVYYIMFYSILFYSFRFILFYAIPFQSMLYYAILLYSILF